MEKHIFKSLTFQQLSTQQGLLYFSFVQECYNVAMTEKLRDHQCALVMNPEESARVPFLRT